MIFFAGISKTLAYITVVIGVLAVGAIDYLTGADVHVLSLYFLPLALAGLRLGRTGAVVASLLSTVVWMAALYTAAPVVHQPYLLIVNFVTQGSAFLIVSALVAILADSVRNEQLLSQTDSLTGLKNRHGFFGQSTYPLLLCRRYARPVCVAYIDLDNFKNVNDSFGHAKGDDLLRLCGRLITDSLRASDIAARLGGDEFVVFLPETSADDGLAVMERLRHALELSGAFQTVGVTASIGFVVDETATSDMNELLQQADARMYRVKSDSKNRALIH